MENLAKIICFGDSITESGGGDGGWITLLGETLNADPERSCEMINCGFSGRTSGEGLDRLGEFVLPHLPGVLLIQFGINDAYVHLWQRISRVSVNEYARHLGEIVRIARERHSQPVIVVAHPLGSRNPGNQGNRLSQAQNVEPYQAIARRVAAEESVPCIDLPALARDRGLSAAEITGGDGVHLAPAGHTFLADAIGKNLYEILAKQI